MKNGTAATRQAAGNGVLCNFSGKWIIHNEYSWDEVTRVTEVDGEVSEEGVGATVQTTKSPLALGIFAHPGLAFNLVTRRDLAH